jgi:hypothetical protein
LRYAADVEPDAGRHDAEGVRELGRVQAADLILGEHVALMNASSTRPKWGVADAVPASAPRLPTFNGAAPAKIVPLTADVASRTPSM